MSGEAGNTTHDWSAAVDHEHLSQVRIDPERYAPGGVVHLLLEVIAYADDEAEALGCQGTCRITLHGDGSVSVADDGRGTETRVDEDGVPTRKPVIATKVVAALSDWLVHTNRRRHGAWTQRYENGIPATDLVAVEGDGTTGTTVHFMPGRPERVTPAQIHRVAAGFPHVRVLIPQKTYRQ